MAVKKDPTKRAKDGNGAFRSKLDYINGKIKTDEDGKEVKVEGYNKRAYDRIIFSVPKGYREQLQDYMQARIDEIKELKNITDRTQEQEERLQELQSKYVVSTRGTPSTNHLLKQLLFYETGLSF